MKMTLVVDIIIIFVVIVFNVIVTNIVATTMMMITINTTIAGVMVAEPVVHLVSRAVDNIVVTVVLLSIGLSSELSVHVLRRVIVDVSFDHRVLQIVFFERRSVQR